MKHPSNYQDLTGLKFNRLTVIGRAGFDKYHKAKWNCQCECGNKCVVLTGHLKTGAVKSCGCARTKVNSYDKLYHIWQGIKQRCYNPNSQQYQYYGAKGIKVCEQWKDYIQFRRWAYSQGYVEPNERGDFSIDRIDSDKDYSPENCRFITIAENTSRAHKGKGRAIAQMSNGKVIAVYQGLYMAAKETGANTSCISMCLNGKRNTAAGYEWSVIENVHDNSEVTQ